LYDTLGDLPGLMNVRNNLGIVYRREARWADALAEQQLALDLARRVGDAWSIGMALANIAETLRGQGDFEQALSTNEEALRVWTQAGYAVGVATVNMNIGVLSAEYGHMQAAREALQRSLLQWEQLDSRLFLPELYRTLAKVEQDRDPDLALEWAERSLEVAREIKARDEEGAALQVLGSVHLVRGDFSSARQGLEEAVHLLRSTGSQLELARSLYLLADVMNRGGEDRAEVVRLAAEALTLFTRVGATREIGRVQALLGDS
jgi:tetratricopeptide (TPR) repeat protein